MARNRVFVLGLCLFSQIGLAHTLTEEGPVDVNPPETPAATPKEKSEAEKLIEAVKSAEIPNAWAINQLTQGNPSVMGPKALAIYEGHCFVEGKKKTFTFYTEQSKSNMAYSGYLEWGAAPATYHELESKKFQWATVMGLKDSEGQKDTDLFMKGNERHGDVHIKVPKLAKDQKATEFFFTTRVGGEEAFCAAKPSGIKGMEKWNSPACKHHGHEDRMLTQFLPVKMDKDAVEFYIHGDKENWPTNTPTFYYKSDKVIEREVEGVRIRESIGMGELKRDSRDIRPVIYVKSASQGEKTLTNVATLMVTKGYQKDSDTLTLESRYSDGSSYTVLVSRNHKDKSLSMKVDPICGRPVPPFDKLTKMNGADPVTKEIAEGLIKAHPIMEEYLKGFKLGDATPDVSADEVLWKSLIGKTTGEMEAELKDEKIELLQKQAEKFQEFLKELQETLKD